MALNDKQRLFAREYLVDRNATEAAIRAGYSKRSAYSTGHDLLKKPEIQAIISERTEKTFRKLEITAESVLTEIAKLAFVNMADFTVVDDKGNIRLNFSRVDDDRMAAVAEVTNEEFTYANEPNKTVRRTKFKHHDKHAALVTLARHLKLLTDVQEHSVAEPLKALLEQISGNSFKPVNKPGRSAA